MNNRIVFKQEELGCHGNTWHKLVTSLKAIHLVNMPRCYFTETGDGKYQPISLYRISDLPCKAYTAVVYMVVATSTRIDMHSRAFIKQ